MLAGPDTQHALAFLARVCDGAHAGAIRASQAEKSRAGHENSDAGRAESGWDTFCPDNEFG